jgi:mannose-6-phosphate isomerase-like protein (cupin superfamily)
MREEPDHPKRPPMTVPPFLTVSLPELPDAIAPDGSEVRILADSPRGTMAHFTLGPGQVSKAIAHRTIEEIWFVVSGAGEMWRSDGNMEQVTELRAGVSLTIMPGTRFQFRANGGEPLCAVGVAMPPWPGDGEAEFVEGRW